MTGDRLTRKLVRAADRFDEEEAGGAAGKGIGPLVRERFGDVEYLWRRYRGRWAKVLGALKKAFPDLDTSEEGYASSTEERLKKAFHLELGARQRRAQAMAPVIALATTQPAYRPAQLAGPVGALPCRQATQLTLTEIQPEDGAYSDPDLEALKRELREGKE